MKQNRLKKYEALGFVEALIAIVVTGMAAIVLMGFASDTINQVLKNERADEMTQIAVEAGSMIKTIASQNNETETIDFPLIEGNVNNCFALSPSTGNPEFTKSGENIVPVCNYDAGQRENCKSALAPGFTDMFRVFCITSQSNSETGLVVGKVIVGKTTCANSEDCDIPDYQYYILNRTKQQ